MYDQKHLELLRYYVLNKVDDLIEEIEDGKKTKIDEMVGTVFSALVSSAVTIKFDVLNGKNEINDFVMILMNIALLSLLFISIRFLVTLIIKKGRIILQRKRIVDGDLSDTDIKKIINKYDHIACDGILFSKYYLGLFHQSKLEEDKSIREFYFYEAIYYFKKSLEIVILIYENRTQCINTGGKSRRIDVYRFNNTVDLLQQLWEEINENFNQFNKNGEQLLNENIMALKKEIASVKKISTHQEK